MHITRTKDDSISVENCPIVHLFVFSFLGSVSSEEKRSCRPTLPPLFCPLPMSTFVPCSHAHLYNVWRRSSKPVQDLADAALLLGGGFGLAFIVVASAAITIFITPALFIPRLLSDAFRASLAELISKFFLCGNLLSIVCAVISPLVMSPTCHR